MTTKKFPPFSKTFTQAWASTKDNLLKLLLLNLVMIGSFLGLFIVVGIFTAIFFGGVFKGAFDGAMTFERSLAFLGSTSTLLILTVVASSLMGYWFKAASIVLLAKDNRATSIRAILGSTLRFVVPMFLVNLLVFYIIAGGFMLLLVPALVFAFFLSFVNLEIVLGGKGVIGALKGSVALISQHFGDILVRMLAFVLFYLAIGVFIPNVITQAEPATGAILVFVSVLVNWILGWFGQAYFITLYKQAKAASDPSYSSGILGFVIAATLGWLLIAGGVAIGYKAASEGISKMMEDRTLLEDQLQQIEEVNRGINSGDSRKTEYDISN